MIEILIAITLIVTVCSKIALLFLCVNNLDWGKTKKEGVTLQLMTFGGFRKQWTQKYIGKDSIKTMALLDSVHYYGWFLLILTGIILLLIGAVKNA